MGFNFLWSKRLADQVRIVHYDDRLLGLRCNLNQTDVLFVSVYMPTQCGENHDLFLSYKGKLAVIIREEDVDAVCLMGNLNTAPNTSFYNELYSLCTENYLVLKLLCNTYMQVNVGNMGTSWLDYIIISNNLCRLVKSCHVRYGNITSDNFPLFANIQVDICVSSVSCEDELGLANWNFQDRDKTDQCEYKSDRALSGMSVGTVVCDAKGCVREEQLNAIDDLHVGLMAAVIETGRSVFGSNKRIFALIR